MAVYGWDGGIEGTGADVCIADDVQNFHNSGTSDRRAKQWNWLTEPFERRLDTTTRTLIVIQTRHAADDFAGRIKEESKAGTWNYDAAPAISEWPPVLDDFIDQDQSKATFWSVENLVDPDKWRSKLLCGDVLSLETLMSEWKPESGRTSFYRTRLNDVADPATKWFPRELLEIYGRADGMRNVAGEKKPRISAWDVNVGVPLDGSFYAKQLEQEGVSIDIRVVSIDTAASSPTPGKDPDYTVLQLWGMDTTRNLRILLDMTRFRTSSPKEFRRRLKQFLDAYDPKFTIFEENGMARWIGRDLNEQMGYPITPYFKTAEVDVEEFKALIESGMMLYAWGDNRSIVKMKVFEDELEAYPNGAHDDTLSAAVQAQQKLRPRGLRETKVLKSSSLEDEEEDITVSQAGLESSIQRLAESLQVVRSCLKH
jgi:phage terminase large subunit-like protein